MVSGCLSDSNSGATTPKRYPPDSADWRLAFEDAFEGDSLDSSSWDVGWGWGRNTWTSPTTITRQNVRVHDGKLKLGATHSGNGISAGGINSRDKVTFGPESYIEAKIKFAGREGFQNAFWAKPDTGAWPPEIDVVELWQDSPTHGETRVSHHNLHYPRSMRPGDRSTHERLGTSYSSNSDLTDEFHRYGVRWTQNRIHHFVDGERISEFEVDPMLRSMTKGSPFYMMLNLNINNIGTADRSEEWNEELVVDRVRIWNRE